MSKNLIIAVVLGVLVLIIGGAIYMTGSNSENYQGLIQKIEDQTEQLKSSKP